MAFRGLIFALGLGFWLCASAGAPGRSLAQADPRSYPSTAPRPVSSASETESSADGPYMLVLGGTYLAAPVLAVPLLMAHPLLGIAAFLGLPLIVHAAYGEPERAVLSPFAVVASMVAGWFIALALQGECSSNLGNLFRCVEGPAIGALVGYVTWGSFDVIWTGLHRGRDTRGLATQ